MGFHFEQLATNISNYIKRVIKKIVLRVLFLDVCLLNKITSFFFAGICAEIMFVYLG